MRRGRMGPGPRRGARRTVRRTARRQVRRQRRRRRRRRMLIGGAIVVGTGALAYKLGKNNAQKVEQHTGQPVDQLSDEELEQAMNDLNLEKEPLEEHDQAYLDEYEESEDSSYLDDLERLGQLRDEGIITEEEFQAKKKQLLGL